MARARIKPAVKTGATTDRGRARRTAILDAALAVVARDGTGAVTHRAVAKRARVPLAATTYYFASRDELLLEAFRHLTTQRMAALDLALAAAPSYRSVEVVAAGLAHTLAELLRSEPARVVAELEMHLEACRRPQLRAVHTQWEAKAMEYFTAALTAVGSRHPVADAAIVLAVMTGLEIGEVVNPTPHAERDLLAPLLRRLLHALVP
ncbi:MAG: TetR family transcriptional regulator [Deltaproteobacteria bacterium]|nr:TetR family transcriptional regulator [Deltaproteobacteria bacterium]